MKKVPMPKELGRAWDRDGCGRMCVFGYLRYHLIAPLQGSQVAGSRLELCDKFGWNEDVTNTFMGINDNAASQEEQLENFRAACAALGVEIEETS